MNWQQKKLYSIIVYTINYRPTEEQPDTTNHIFYLTLMTGLPARIIRHETVTTLQNF